MVITQDQVLSRYIKMRLPHERFEVFDTPPGQQTIDATYAVSPHIAVLDHIERRIEAVQMEIALLRKRCPQVQIILASSCSSTEEASLVEQGVFYYFAGRAKCELVRVIQAAADALVDSAGRDIAEAR